MTLPAGLCRDITTATAVWHDADNCRESTGPNAGLAVAAYSCGSPREPTVRLCYFCSVCRRPQCARHPPGAWRQALRGDMAAGAGIVRRAWSAISFRISSYAIRSYAVVQHTSAGTPLRQSVAAMCALTTARPCGNESPGTV